MTKDMTKGPVFTTLVTFTIPLVLGNLLQLTYNAIDSMIVGRFVGRNALAAVGTSNPLMTLILLFTNGICLGAGILVSFHYGAKQYDILQRQVSTGMISGIIFSALVALGVTAAARPILMLLQVQDEILDESVMYLRTIMMGLVFSFVYNYLASMLRSMGDSKSPLYFLGASAILNIFGDLLFVIVFGLGTFGAGLSTVVCEGLAAVLCWFYTVRKIQILRLGRKWLIFDKSQFQKICSYGIVSALQQSTVQMGKIATQGIVNTLGVAVTAAFNATNRMDDYACIPEQNIAHAMTSVMAQNVGARKNKRVSLTFRYGMILEVCFGFLAAFVFFFAAHPIMAFFTDDEEVIAEGVRNLRLIAFMYPLPGITNGLQGYFRGIGDLKITLVSSIINMGVRAGSLAVMVFGFGFGFEAVPFAYLSGWLVMIAFELPYLIRCLRTHANRFEQNADSGGND
ncbi:MAG: MATE family efflux transporter [Lachnospiraceae bacterium]